MTRAIVTVLFGEDPGDDMTRTRTVAALGACETEACEQAWLRSLADGFVFDYPGIEMVYAKPPESAPVGDMDLFAKIMEDADAELKAMGLEEQGKPFLWGRGAYDAWAD